MKVLRQEVLNVAAMLANSEKWHRRPATSGSLTSLHLHKTAYTAPLSTQGCRPQAAACSSL